MESFSEVIAHLHERGLSNGQIGEAVGVHRSQVGRWERLEGLPKAPTVRRLADAFGLDYQRLMVLTGNDPSAPASDGDALTDQERRVLAAFRRLGQHEQPVAVRVVEALAGSARRQADGQRPAAGSDGTGHLVRPKIPWRGPADALAAWLLGAPRPRPLVGLP